MARNEGSGEMLAALLPSKSAILMTALNAPPTEAFADQRWWSCICRQRRGAHRRRGYGKALEKTADGSAVRLADGPYVGSMFYASAETYDAFHTCNTWTALVLHDGGLPMDHAACCSPVRSCSRCRGSRRCRRHAQ